MKPIELEVLRVRLQRVIKENQVYRSLYRNHMALLPDSDARPTESLPESLRRREEAETEALRRKEESGAEEWQLQLHHLQEQLQEREESLSVSRERVRYLQYAVNRLREAMSAHSIQPPILTEYDYYRLLQRRELDGLRGLFGERLLVTVDDECLSSFCDQVDLPLSLLPSLLRNFFSLAYPLGSSRERERSVCEKRWVLESPSNPVKAQSQPVFAYLDGSCSVCEDGNGSVYADETCSVYADETYSVYADETCSVNEVFSSCVDSLPTVLQLDVLEDWWNSFLRGYSPKRRLYRLVGDGGVVTYVHLKRMVCDYLLTHPKTVRRIHDMNQHGEENVSTCALSELGRDGLCWAEVPSTLCCHCSVYVITVAAAILFDLTGYLSSTVHFRQLSESRLVGLGWS